MLLTPAIMALTVLAGCRQRTGDAGHDLPTTGASSRALPGSVNAADAPEAAVTTTDKSSVSTFHDPEIGLTFQYPATWRPLVTGGPMRAPRLQELTHHVVQTQAFLPGGTPLAHTNLVGISFSWTMQPGLSSVDCALAGKKLLRSAAVTRESIQGVNFSRADGGDAGMCHQVRSTVDSTLRQNGCLLIERDMETICPGIKNQGEDIALTPNQTATLKAQLDAVMASVKLQ